MSNVRIDVRPSSPLRRGLPPYAKRDATAGLTITISAQHFLLGIVAAAAATEGGEEGSRCGNSETLRNEIPLLQVRATTS